MLQTARFPLSAFTGATLASIRGVRLTFSATPSGRIYVANIRASRSTLVAGASATAPSAVDAGARLAQQPAARGPITPGVTAPFPVRRITSGNLVISMRSTPDGAVVQIALGSSTKFLPRNARLVLRIGDVTASRVAHLSADLTRVTFPVDRESFNALANGEPIRVRYEPGSGIEWEIGSLDKTLLAP
jgi:hypothetical protein